MSVIEMLRQLAKTSAHGVICTLEDAEFVPFFRSGESLGMPSDFR
jgi:hypothetical protein